MDESDIGFIIVSNSPEIMAGGFHHSRQPIHARYLYAYPYSIYPIPLEPG